MWSDHRHVPRFPPSMGFNKDSASKREAMRRGLRHLQFCCAVYRWQVQRGAGILHEHSWGASSFRFPCVQAVRRLPGVTLTRTDQCMFGQMAWHKGPSGWERLHARKRTGWLCNVPEIAANLEATCDGTHRHASLLGNTARPTERYPPRLVAAILRGLVAYSRRVAGMP